MTSLKPKIRHLERWKNGLIEKKSAAIIGDIDRTRIKTDSNQGQMTPLEKLEATMEGYGFNTG